MAQYVAVRSLNRNINLRVTNSAGNQAKLSTTTDVVVDLDLASNRRTLAHHKAIGQYIVTAANATEGVVGTKVALPANS